jgi:flavin reductase (DIM6/NTAB) family NADH-FMN oxidoreductase RutF
MALVGQVGRMLKRVIYGDTLLPGEFTLGLHQPQCEVRVTLEAFGTSLDVTRKHTIACCAPFLVGIHLGADSSARLHKKDAAPVLRFSASSGDMHRLGELRLEPVTCIPIQKSELVLFRVLGLRNYCLPTFRLWAHYLPAAYSNWRHLSSFDVKMSSHEIRASYVAFIRPHPIALGSIQGDFGGNIFPMNLMGELSDSHFAFALKDSRRPAHLIERLGRLALSNIPLSLCSTAFQLAANHKKESIDWGQLPFPLSESSTLRIPVPAAAGRVRELCVEQIHKLGSHTLFIARILSDELRFDVPQAHAIHGFYQHWRLRHDREKLRLSIDQDRVNKHA